MLFQQQHAGQLSGEQTWRTTLCNHSSVSSVVSIITAIRTVRSKELVLIGWITTTHYYAGIDDEEKLILALLAQHY